MKKIIYDQDIINTQGIKEDRRVLRTKKMLSRSLAKLMSEKKINKITVTELTELADVNRSTFYLYYKDIYDMLDKIETEMFEDFSKALKKLAMKEGGYDNVLSFFTFVFEFVLKNADMCKVLLGPNGDYNFLNKFKEAIIESRPPIILSLTDVGSRYFMPFAIAGCIGVIQQWLEDDMKAPPKDIAVFVIDLISKGVNSFNEKNKFD